MQLKNDNKINNTIGNKEIYKTTIIKNKRNKINAIEIDNRDNNNEIMQICANNDESFKDGFIEERDKKMEMNDNKSQSKEPNANCSKLS